MPICPNTRVHVASWIVSNIRPRETYLGRAHGVSPVALAQYANNIIHLSKVADDAYAVAKFKKG